MTQEDKDLLLKNLCARLPYGVKCAAVTTNNEPNTIGGYCEMFDDFYIREVGGWFNISMIKPYLRPMSSMTEEEKKEIGELLDASIEIDTDGNITYFSGCDFIPCSDYQIYIDYLNAHHLDYRGLISKGLALEAPANMYK